MGNNGLGDTNFYHLQSLKWIKNHQIVFGLVNLENRLALPSIWHNFLAIINIKIYDFNTYYLGNHLGFVLFFLNIFNIKKINNYSNSFLFLSGLLILFLSILHPQKNGIILSYLGSIDFDHVAHLFFLLTIKVFLSVNFNSNLYYNKKISLKVSILISIVFLTLFIKFYYSPLLIILIYLLFKLDLNFESCKKFIFSILGLFILYLLKNFILSSCLVYPVQFLCINTIWQQRYDEFIYFVNIAKSFPRSAPFRDVAGNFDYTIRSLEWIKPWFIGYFLKTSISQICTLMFFLSFILLFKKKVMQSICNQKTLIILLISLFLFYIFFQAPEIRYFSGFLIFLSLFILSYYLTTENKFNQYISKNINLIFLFTFIVLVFKNFLLMDKSYLIKKIIFSNYSYKNLFFEKKTVNGFEIVESINGNCFDTIYICKNFNYKKFQLVKKNNYLFILDIKDDHVIPK